MFQFRQLFTLVSFSFTITVINLIVGEEIPYSKDTSNQPILIKPTKSLQEIYDSKGIDILSPKILSNSRSSNATISICSFLNSFSRTTAYLFSLYQNDTRFSLLENTWKNVLTPYVLQDIRKVNLIKTAELIAYKAKSQTLAICFLPPKKEAEALQDFKGLLLKLEHVRFMPTLKIVFFCVQGEEMCFNKHFLEMISHNQHSEAFLGFMKPPSGLVEMTKLFYVSQCEELLQTVLHEVSELSQKGIEKSVYSATAGGMNCLWHSVQERGIQPTEKYACYIPYVQNEVNLKFIVQSSVDFSIERFLLHVLMSGNNSTKYFVANKAVNLSQTEVWWNYKLPRYPMITTRFLSFESSNIQLPVIFDVDSYNYVSCYGAMFSRRDALAYANGFHWEVWMCILISIILICILASLVLRRICGMIFGQTFRLLFESMIFAMIWQFPHRFLKPNNREAVIIYRSIFGSFLLMSLVLTNLLVGLMITTATKPLPFTFNVTDIGELVNSTLIVSLRDEDSRELNGITNELPNHWDVNATDNARNFKLGLGIKLGSASDFKLEQVSKQVITTTSPINVIVEHMKKNDCELPTYYLVPNSKLTSRFTLVEGLADCKECPFYHGNSKFFSVIKGWKVSINGRAMIRKLESILRSGIYDMVQNLKYFSEDRKAMMLKEKRKQNKNTSDNYTFTHFVVLIKSVCMLWSVSFLVHIFEHLCRTLVKYFTNGV